MQGLVISPLDNASACHVPETKKPCAETLNATRNSYATRPATRNNAADSMVFSLPTITT